MEAEKSLFDTLVVLKDALSEDVYDEIAPKVIEDWRYEHSNPVFLDVLECRTTFGEQFLPIAKANLDIDLVEGTSDSFVTIAETAKSAFKDIISLSDEVGKHSSNLTGPYLGRRELRRSFLRPLVIGGSMLAFVAAAFVSLISPYSAVFFFLLFLGMVAVFSLMIWFSIGNYAKESYEARMAAVEAVSKRVTELDKLIAHSV
jgi:hypothetical protein